MFDKIKDAIFGSPRVHTVGTGPNRKQKRVAARLRRKQATAAKRKEHKKR